VGQIVGLETPPPQFQVCSQVVTVGQFVGNETQTPGLVWQSIEGHGILDKIVSALAFGEQVEVFGQPIRCV
jgi:hypothetical protein